MADDRFGADNRSWATGRLLSVAARLTEQAWNDRLREFGLTHAGAAVLATLVERTVSQRSLATELRVTEQTMARTLAHLERAGYLDRAGDSSDRRRRSVTLTDRGRTLLDSLVRRGDRLTDDVLSQAGLDIPAFRSALLTLIDELGGPAGRTSDPDRPR